VYDANLDRMRLGFAYGLEPVEVSPGKAATKSLDYMWLVTSKTVTTIGQIFDAEKREEISSVVGTYEVTRQAIEFDARRALLLLAVISLSLAIINLFPFLPLDGGHIFWSIVEKLRGKPVSFQVMERASVLGFVLVLMLFAVGLSNDIGRLTGDGFGVR
jgi:regulator of sigma E protease